MCEHLRKRKREKGKESERVRRKMREGGMNRMRNKREGAKKREKGKWKKRKK